MLLLMILLLWLLILLLLLLMLLLLFLMFCCGHTCYYRSHYILLWSINVFLRLIKAVDFVVVVIMHVVVVALLVDTGNIMFSF